MPLFRIVSGAISSELALPLPFTHVVTSLAYQVYSGGLLTCGEDETTVPTVERRALSEDTPAVVKPGVGWTPSEGITVFAGMSVSSRDVSSLVYSSAS